MRCREVKKGLVAYMDGEVMPSERTLIEAHLAGCESCERELSALGSSRSRMADSLKTMAAQAAPSAQAWSHLQARLAEEVRATHRQGDRVMKMRWKIVFGTAAAIVLAAAVIAVVPSTRAAAGSFFAGVFNLSESQPVQLGYLPDGFSAQPLYTTGMATAGAQGEDVQKEEQVLYQNGDLFLVVKTSSNTSEALPTGETAEVNGLPAILRSGLSGTLDGPELPDIKDGDPGVSAGGVNVESGQSVVSGELPAQGSIVVGGADGALTVVTGNDAAHLAPEISPITYDNASALTWDANGTRVEILTNLPVDELMKIAQAVILPE